MCKRSRGRTLSNKTFPGANTTEEALPEAEHRRRSSSRGRTPPKKLFPGTNTAEKVLPGAEYRRTSSSQGRTPPKKLFPGANTAKEALPGAEHRRNSFLCISISVFFPVLSSVLQEGKLYEVNTFFKL